MQKASISRGAGRRGQDQVGKKGYVRPDRLICGPDELDSVADSKICRNANISKDSGAREQDRETNNWIRMIK